ncbi:uncharacterized protein F4807DRAFT_291824 [Annulohypoxylon truncatum]|uniref:uncharacterized protein n=1 Tax=Annulohypoxylon truncatum TaxID=327061 RepID=UPI002008027A|nr:uncharacterized protein F4807DRAFT_291824 [Annulohypoxylon truncatum]KAI1205262.1 hypothetical protein F4807DRAFT_291824 [Annulohypoxylon truncatum]
MSNSVATQFDWAVQLYGFDLTNSNIFYFLAVEDHYPPDSSPWTMSPFFNITDGYAVNNSGTTNSITPSNPLSTTTPPSSTISSDPIEDEKKSNTGEDSGGLSVGAKVDIGIPVTIIGLAALFCTVYYLRQKKRNQRQTDDAGEAGSEPAVQEVLATTHSIGPFELALRE